MGKNTAKNVILGTLIGLGVGYMTGVLTAPKSGKETRDDIKRNAAKTMKDIEARLRSTYDELDSTLDEAKNKARELGVRGKRELAELQEKAEDAKYKMRELMYAVREGSADDPELQAAIAQATRAKDNLLNYLKRTSK